MNKILTACLFIFTSCASNLERAENKEDNGIRIQGQLHGDYLVSELRGKNVNSGDIFFRFDSIKREVAGNTGCNRFNSVYRHTESMITFQPAVSTKMYCEGKMEREKEVIEILPEISEIIRRNEEILLISADNELLLKLRKTNRSE